MTCNPGPSPVALDRIVSNKLSRPKRAGMNRSIMANEVFACETHRDWKSLQAQFGVDTLLP